MHGWITPALFTLRRSIFHVNKWTVNQPYLKFHAKQRVWSYRTFLTLHESYEMDLKGRVLVYSILGCPHCMRAKNTLQSLGLSYTDVSLEMFPQCREDMQMRTGRRTVPQVFFNALHIGGNDELQELVKNKVKWREVLEEVISNESPPDAPQPPDPSTAVDDGDPGDIVCEPDEYAELVNELRKSGIIKDHRHFLKVHKNSFVGKEFIDWVVRVKGLDRNVALEMGQELINRHFGQHIHSEETFQDNSQLYTLLDDDDTVALNSGYLSECQPQPAGVLGEEIRKMILKIYNAFLSSDGKKVDYKGIAGSTEFQRYLRLTKELVRIQIVEASREEKLAFFINIYNALVIHANIVMGPPVNLWQRYKFFNTVKYLIGGRIYSLQDIENGVLRANRKGVGMLTRPFSQSDPRFKVALEKHEPLIHFALVCGAKSCPPIKTYTTEGIYEQLELAAMSFLEDDTVCLVDMNKKQIKLSQILKWYQEDFGRDKQEVVHWVHDHMSDGTKKSNLSELLSSKNFKLSYLPYDWGLNS